MKVFIVSFLLIGAAFAAPGIMDNQVHSDDSSVKGSTKMLGSCGDSDDMLTCLAVKGITALNRAARSQVLEVIPGVSFVR